MKFNPLIHFHGVMHFESSGANKINLRLHDTNAAFSVYIENAVTLARSLKKNGYGFTLHTNDTKLCKALLGPAGESLLNVTPLQSYYTPPVAINFFSAHQKLNVYRTLAEAADGVHCVVDLDMVMLNKIPDWLHNIWRSDKGTVYDITTQVVPSVGHARIRSDLFKLTGQECEGRWYGGEFIAGNNVFWAEFSRRIELNWDSYEHNYKEFSHQGDESLTSASLQTLNGANQLALDVGAFDVVKRHWSVCTEHEQTSLDSCSKNLSLLHLPADKGFLAQCAETDFDNHNRFFLRRYALEYRKRKMLSWAKHTIKNW